MKSYIRKCSTCRHEIVFAEEAQSQECGRCLTVNYRLKAENDALNAFKRADDLRDRGDFENAISSYQAVLNNYPEEHEALWSLVLCRYRVVYEEDRRTGEWHATLGAMQDTFVQEDPNFLMACERADEKQRAKYIRDARRIDDTLAAIRQLQTSCEPFDVFICHKTSPLGGEGYTEDYRRGSELYKLLTDMGYRVFFAPEEMENTSAAANYEAGIFYALSTSKLMLVVCSNPEHLESTWVRSEWRRYLNMMAAGEKKGLLPLRYADMPVEKLPEAFQLRKLQTVRMGEAKSMEQLLKTVAKYVGSREKPMEYAPEEDFEVEPVPGGCTVKRYTGAALRVKLPPVIRGLQVVAISDAAFLGQGGLTDVILPQGTAAIGAMAFSGCSSLRALTIPAGVRAIGEKAFLGCSGLTELTLPAGVQSIGEKTFLGCSSLERLALPASLQCVGEKAFFGCASLVAVSMPAETQHIGGWAFMCCTALKDVKLCGSLRSIGRGAFLGCTALRQVHIPASVESIGEEAFEGGTTLHGAEGSAAQRYARQCGTGFIAV